MSDHYYSKHPQSKNITETKHVMIQNEAFTFTTGTGVFAKKGIDFGTRLLIENFRLPEIEGDLLDLGCGYGPIGITLARFYNERTIMMVDVNERAVSLAQLNAEQNDVSNVEIKQSDGFQNVINKRFAAIVTNPPIRAGKKLIYHLFKKSITYLPPNGELWIVIQKKQGAPSAITFLSSIFELVETVVRKKGYYVIRAINKNGN